MIKKVAMGMLAIFVMVFLLGCQKDAALNNSDENIECSVCGQINIIENDFCSACGCGLKASIGNPEDFYNEGTRPIEDVRQNYSLLSYFKSISDKPLIIYDCGGIAKDEKVNQAYVIKNGQCRKYYCSATLGELSKMTDEQILEMLEDYYQEGLSEALSTWKSDYNTANAISSGKVKLYEPRAYHIKGCLFTDSTGNSVDGELLFFPQAGVSATPYVIEYPQFSNLEDRFMNYYGTYKDSDSPWDIKFNIEHFNRGNGTQSDINQINDLYYITSSSMITGTVYNSNYYALKSKGNEWVRYGGRTLCFRVGNPAHFNISLDTLSSSDVSFIDPTESNLLQISLSYYNAYYSSFEILK